MRPLAVEDKDWLLDSICSPRYFTTCVRALCIAASRPTASSTAGLDTPQKYCPLASSGRRAQKSQEFSGGGVPPAATGRNAKYVSLNDCTFFHCDASRNEALAATGGAPRLPEALRFASVAW